MIADYIKARRWFRAKARGLASATIDETFPLRLDDEDVALAVVKCTYADGGADRYVLPFAVATGAEAERLRKEEPHLVIGDVTSELLTTLDLQSEPSAIFYDALGSERLLGALLNTFRDGGTKIASLHIRPFPGFDEAARAKDANVTPRPTKTEQTNTSIVYGNTFILKIVRQLDDGTSAELEMGAFLTQHGHASSPQVVGAIEIERPGKEPATVGVLHRFVANEGDAWTFTLKELEGSASANAYEAHATLLGQRVGEMHAVLASGGEPAFVVERLDKKQRRLLGDAVNAQAKSLASWLREGDEAKIAKTVNAFVELNEDPPRMRVHGDLHLGQILKTADDFIIIDFEGEPSRSLAERKGKRAPLADVAGMLRSFDYAAASAQRAPSSAKQASTTETARAWYVNVYSAFLAAYSSAIHDCAALRMSKETFVRSLDFYLLEKCLYELAYEANNRPDWIAIPQSGIRNLLDGASRT